MTDAIAFTRARRRTYHRLIVTRAIRTIHSGPKKRINDMDTKRSGINALAMLLYRSSSIESKVDEVHGRYDADNEILLHVHGNENKDVERDHEQETFFGTASIEYRSR